MAWIFRGEGFEMKQEVPAESGSKVLEYDQKRYSLPLKIGKLYVNILY
ncbi:hypothetical protein [Agriterribacter sp.]|nr:hypothetical protein [Agriterribacter sp.]HTN07705.1 hypothetical protein [Agriterribacter sp.]